MKGMNLNSKPLSRIVFVFVILFTQYSICNEPLIELSNPGASGSLFYLTSDDEFIIKTVQHKEAEFLQKLLPGYYMVGPIDSISFLLLYVIIGITINDCRAPGIM